MKGSSLLLRGIQTALKMFGMGIIFHLMWLFVGAGFAGRALQFPAPLHAKPLIGEFKQGAS